MCYSKKGEDSTMAGTAKPAELSLTSAGGSITTHAPLFTPDSKFFFVSCGNNVRMYSVASGEIVHALEGHGDIVNGYALNRHNAQQLYTWSRNGTIKVWDYSDGALLATYETQRNLVHVMCHPTSRTELIAVIKDTTNVKGATHTTCLYSINLKPKKGTVAEKVHVILKHLKGKGFCTNADGTLIAFFKDRRFTIYNLTTKTEIKAEHTTNITCISLHPTELCLATGDAQGVITRWLFNDKNEPITTNVHWHAHAVKSVCFTNEGTYMISGGEERVLVVWQLASGTRNFLPRLGAELVRLSVSSDDSHYAVALSDNSVRIINVLQFKSVQHVHGLHLEHDLLCGLVVEPRNNHIALLSSPGTVQLYNPLTDRHVFETEVVSQNVVSRMDEKAIIPTKVDHVAYSRDGRTMATVESRIDLQAAPERRLKIWSLDPNTQRFVMNTSIESPHNATVVRAVFHPTQPMLVTCGLDRKFKIWVRAADRKEGREYWVCGSVGFYRDFLSHDADFAEDGSLLAVAYGQTVTLWDPSYTALLNTLTHSVSTEEVKRVMFVPKTHFLVTYSESHLWVWNLLTCSVWWSYRVVVDAAAAEPFNGRFAVVSSTTQGKERTQTLLVFDVQSPIPVAVHRLGATIVTSLVYLPERGSNQASLVLLDNTRTIHLVGRDLQRETAAEEVAAAKQTQDAKATTFNTIFGAAKPAKAAAAQQHAAAKQLESDIHTSASAPGQKAAADVVFAGPAHLAPPVTQVYMAFMSHLLGAGGKKESEHDRVVSLKRANSDSGVESDEEDTIMQDATADGPATAEAQPTRKVPLPAPDAFDFMADFFKGNSKATEPAVAKGQSVNRKH
eukprot:Colp12_sorted_trinity150504_noHs@23611